MITGGTKGIGAAIAIDLARQGCDVAINGRHDDAAAAATKRAIEAAGRNVRRSSPTSRGRTKWSERSAKPPAALGGLDILVHSAGGPSLGTIDECSPEQWNATFDVHVHAAYLPVPPRAADHAQSGEGAIIFVSSVAGIRGVPNAIAYGTAKGAILQFTRCLARDEADDNIRVNCVAPGIIRTRFHESMTPEAKAHNLAVRIPLHREGTPEQVAEAVRLLVTNEFITGELIVVDGGAFDASLPVERRPLVQPELFVASCYD